MRYFGDQSCLSSYKMHVGHKVEIKSNFTSYFISSPVLITIFVPPPSKSFGGALICGKGSPHSDVLEPYLLFSQQL